MRGKITALVGICLLVFAGLVGAVINATVTITPTQSYEGATQSYNLTVSNPSIQVCSVNLTMPGFTVGGAQNLDNWTITLYSNSIYWTTITGCITSPTGSVGFPFSARANLVGSNSTDTWTIVIEDFGGTDNGTYFQNTTVFNDPEAPAVTLDSPTDGANVSGNPALTCSATENNDLDTMTLYWDYGSIWVANDTYSVSGTSNQSIFSHQLASDGTYIWNCYACDVTGNCSFAPSNFSFMTDITKPVVTLYTPTSQVYDTGSLNLNYDASDNIARDECWLYNSSSDTNYTLPFCQNATLNLVDGYYTVIVYANDSVNNINSDGVSFIVDLTNPAVSADSPGNGYNSSLSSVTVYWTATDNLDSNLNCNVTIDGSVVLSDDASANGTQMSHTQSFSEGNHYWNVTCRDDANRSATTTMMMFTVDTVDPVIAFASPDTPANDTYLPVNYFAVNVTNMDLHPDTIILYVNNAINQTKSYVSGVDSGFDLIAPDGVYTYSVRLNDTAGNPAQTENRTLTIDTTSPLVSFLSSSTANNANLPIGSNLYINVSHMDTNLDSVILEIGGLPNETVAQTTSLSTLIVKTYGNGVYNYIVYVNDSAGNMNATETRNVTFYVPPPPPPPSPGSSFTGSSGGYSPPICKENWNCTNWTTECINFEYTRTCSDDNSCGTEKTRPAKAIACTLPSEDGPVAPSTLCTPGDMKCSGSNLVECDDDGSVWRLVVACEYGCENAVCKDEMVVSPSSGEAGLTGFLVDQGANVAAVAAGSLLIIGGAYYYFRIRRFKVL